MKLYYIKKNISKLLLWGAVLLGLWSVVLDSKKKILHSQPGKYTIHRIDWLKQLRQRFMPIPEFRGRGGRNILLHPGSLWRQLSVLHHGDSSKI